VAAPLPSLQVEATDAVIARKRLAELGRLLATAEGYQVLTSTGHRLGRVEHVRYQRYADRPDEIVVRSRMLLRTRRRAYTLSAVREIKPRERTVVIDPADDVEVVRHRPSDALG
jgi:sporulation protein YlmC with PRC-barrel domain